MAVLGQPGNALHFLLVQNQQHKHLRRYFPFALDSMSAGGPETKSGVIVRVPQNDDEWAAGVLEFPVSPRTQAENDCMSLAEPSRDCGFVSMIAGNGGGTG